MRDHSSVVQVSGDSECYCNHTSLYLAYLARPGVLDQFPAILIPLPCISGAPESCLVLCPISSTPVNAAAYLRRVEAERVNPSSTFRVRFKQVQQLQHREHASAAQISRRVGPLEPEPLPMAP